LAKWVQLNTTQYPCAGTTDVGFYSTFAYDVVYVYVAAIQYLIANNSVINGANILSALSFTNITGITGQIQFDSNLDRSSG
jgi:ABC-type branched-subunit amino acid transport system substrate-binding protein